MSEVLNGRKNVLWVGKFFAGQLRETLLVGLVKE